MKKKEVTIPTEDGKGISAVEIKTEEVIAGKVVKKTTYTTSDNK